MGNAVNPALQGNALKLSEVVVLLSVFWGWLWGTGGAFIAVPLITAVVLLYEKLDATRPFARFFEQAASVSPNRSLSVPAVFFSVWLATHDLSS